MVVHLLSMAGALSLIPSVTKERKREGWKEEGKEGLREKEG